MARAKYNDAQYIGFKSGKLTVVGFAQENNQFRWQCKCECNGNIKNYHPSKVFLGRIQSCGCEKINNKTKYTDSSYINKIYNNLQVLGIAKPQGQYDGTIWKCKCLICGREDLEFPAKHVVAGRYTTCGSVDCRRKAGLTNAKYDDPKYIGENFGYLTVLSFEPGYTSYGARLILWKCKCNICGTIKKISAESVMKGNNISCGCLRLVHEHWIAKILDKHSLKYKQEFTFSKLTGLGGGKLRFDFALFNKQGELTKLIEYDGGQHRDDSEYSTSHWDLERIQIHDELKNEFCNANNIQLLRINKRFNCIESLEKYMIENKIIEV